MKKFLFCTAYYGIFFYWVKMNYGDETIGGRIDDLIFSDEIETVTKCVLFLVPWVLIAILCLIARMFNVLAGLCLAAFIMFVLFPGISYFAYLVILWILSGLLGSGSGSGSGSGGGYKSEWEKEQDWLRDNIQ